MTYTYASLHKTLRTYLEWANTLCEDMENLRIRIEQATSKSCLHTDYLLEISEAVYHR